MSNSSEGRKETIMASLLITKISKARVLTCKGVHRQNTQDKDKMAAGSLWAAFLFLTIIHTPILLRSEGPLLHPMAVVGSGVQ